MGKRAQDLSHVERAEILLEIFERHAEGETLREIFKTEKRIARGTLYRWLEAENEELRDQYRRAREMYADSEHDRIKEVVKKAHDSVYYDKEGNARIDSGAVLAARLEVESIQWSLGRTQSKKYGAKPEEDTGGKNDQIPRTTIIGQEKLGEPLK